MYRFYTIKRSNTEACSIGSFESQIKHESLLKSSKNY